MGTSLRVPKEDKNLANASYRASKYVVVVARRAAWTDWKKFLPYKVGILQTILFQNFPEPRFENASAMRSKLQF